MAFVIADRVRETTTTTGTGTITLAGAATSFQTFSAAIGNGNSTYYTISNPAANEWEVGIGTYTSAGNTLSRTTVLASSNTGSLVSFSAGTKDVFVTQPAERSLLVQSAGSGLFAGVAAFTNNGAVYANSTTTLTTGTLPIASGGTNSTATPTAGGVGYGTGTAHAYSSAGTSGQALLSGGTGAPTFGTLGTGAGGTGLTAFTANQVFYASSTSAVAQSTNLQFNGTTLTLANDASINGQTHGKGGGNVATNTAVGASALAANTSGASNTGIGYQSLYSNNTASYNTAVGYQAGYSNTSGTANTALGYQALLNSTSVNNTAVGYQAGYGNTSGSNNTVMGYSAGLGITTGTRNTFVGSETGDGATTGSNNTFAGCRIGHNNTNTGNSNVVVGNFGLYGNTSGSSNSVLGYDAMESNTTGSNNVAVGQQALWANNTASNNTALGYQAGYNISTGANNLCVGYVAGTDAVRNITTNSNEIVMGNNSNTAAYIKIAWTVTSDQRDKTSFASVPLGLDFINSLTPTAYRFRVSREDKTPSGPVRYGFKAQDILAAEGANPVIIDNSDPENLKYNQDSMVAVLVNAIQELTSQLNSVKAELAILKGN